MILWYYIFTIFIVILNIECTWACNTNALWVFFLRKISMKIVLQTVSKWLNTTIKKTERKEFWLSTVHQAHEYLYLQSTTHIKRTTCKQQMSTICDLQRNLIKFFVLLMWALSTNNLKAFVHIYWLFCCCFVWKMFLISISFQRHYIHGYMHSNSLSFH